MDTDGDGLTDSEEVNWDFIKIEYDDKGNQVLVLPTLHEYMKLTGVSGGLNVNLASDINPVLSTILSAIVLPIRSNPANRDTDGRPRL